ncbi:hypothetical protein HanRHA438_Chr03g0119281 [Helianthus annuus]|nr:hypothetical protein HanRHA438_Chr03g0119281 [Helianthus annuus]
MAGYYNGRKPLLAFRMKNEFILNLSDILLNYLFQQVLLLR